MPRETKYKFQLTVPIGNDELWEDIEKLKTLRERKTAVKENILANLESDGWLDCKLSG